MTSYNASENQEDLKSFFSELGIPSVWIKKDKHEFSRTLKIKTKENFYEIVWFKNLCTLKREDLELPFTNISKDSTYPSKGDWIRFNGGYNTLRLRIK